MNRLFLRASGVYYPRPETGSGLLRASHREIIEAARLGRREDDLSAVQALLARYAERVDRNGAQTAVLSAEGLSAVRNGFVGCFAPLAQRFDVRVVVFLRRADTFMESFYRQKIKLGRAVPPFPQYLEQELPRVGRRRLLPISRWAEVFGEAAVSVVPFEPAVAGFDLLERFVQEAGLPPVVLRFPRWDRRIPNPSLSRAQAEVLRQLNATGLPITRHQLRNLRKIVATPDAGYLSEHSRARVLAAAESADAEICARFVGDGRSALYPEPPEQVVDCAQDWDGSLPQDVLDKAAKALGLSPDRAVAA